MHASLDVLRIPDFRRYLSSRFLMTFALQMQSVVVAWQVFSITKDPLSLGLIGLAEVIPAISFALIAGHIVDRSERKTIVLLAQLLTLVASLSLWILSVENFFQDNLQLKIYTIYFCIFLSGIARAFMASSLFAFFGQIIPKEKLVRASAWNSTFWQTASSLGPATGGLIYGYFGVSYAYLLICLFLIISVGAMSQIPKRGVIAKAIQEPFTQSLTVGIKFVFQNKIVLSALSLDLFAVLFGGAIALLPLFADILQVGPEGLGLMRAAPSVGAMIALIFITRNPPTKYAGSFLLAAVAGFGLSIICFAISKNLYLSLFFLAINGAFDSISVVTRSAILQLLTPDEMRGRVSAVNSIFISSSNELGAFESGVAAKWMGTIPSVIFGGCMTLCVVIATIILSPQMRKLNLKKLGRIE
ncbi:MAG: MFS transporter [Deltaproteobacteria bacterium]|nr:MFS transporter [Deltaproteobacteria bacterium]